MLAITSTIIIISLLLHLLVVFLPNHPVPLLGAIIMRDAWNFFSGKTSEKVAIFELRDIRRLFEVGEIIASTAWLIYTYKA